MSGIDRLTPMAVIDIIKEVAPGWSLGVPEEIARRLCEANPAAGTGSQAALARQRGTEADDMSEWELLQRVRDWLKFAANSEGGIVAEIDNALRPPACGTCRDTKRVARSYSGGDAFESSVPCPDCTQGATECPDCEGRGRVWVEDLGGAK